MLAKASIYSVADRNWTKVTATAGETFSYGRGNDLGIAIASWQDQSVVSNELLFLDLTTYECKVRLRSNPGITPILWAAGSSVDGGWIPLRGDQNLEHLDPGLYQLVVSNDSTDEVARIGIEVEEAGEIDPTADANEHLYIHQIEYSWHVLFAYYGVLNRLGFAAGNKDHTRQVCARVRSTNPELDEIGQFWVGNAQGRISNHFDMRAINREVLIGHAGHYLGKGLANDPLFNILIDILPDHTALLPNSPTVHLPVDREEFPR